MSSFWLPKKNLLYSLTSSQIWFIPLVDDFQSTYLTNWKINPWFKHYHICPTKYSRFSNTNHTLSHLRPSIASNTNHPQQYTPYIEVICKYPKLATKSKLRIKTVQSKQKKGSRKLMFGLLSTTGLPQEFHPQFPICLTSISLLEHIFLIKFCQNQTLLNPVSCMTPSFAQFKSTLKLEMKQGLQGQTGDQRQSSDFKDHITVYTNTTRPIFFNVPFLLVTIKSTGDNTIKRSVSSI